MATSSERDLNRVEQLAKLDDDTLVDIADFACLACLTPSYLYIDTTQPAPRGGKLAAMGIVPVRVGRRKLFRVGDHKKIGAAQVQPERARDVEAA